MNLIIIASLPRSLVTFRGHLISDLTAAGHHVHALAPGLSRDSEVTRFLDARGATWADIPLERTGANPIADFRAAAAIHREIGRTSPDLVLAYTIKPVVWGTMAAALRRVPSRVALVTGVGFALSTPQGVRRRATAWCGRLLLKAALGRASHIILQNRDDLAECQRRRVLSRSSTAVVVDGSGVDLSLFSIAPTPPVPPTRFLVVARLLGAKGVREYLQAARSLCAAYPDAEFHLVGGHDPGPDAVAVAEVQQAVDDGIIIWHGEQPDVRPHLAACHVFVLPSYREGLPRSTQEAMATGRAIISTDVPGCRETVVEGSNGFLVPPRDAVALAAAMERMILNPGLFGPMGRASRKIAEDRFDVRRINSQMLQAMGC